MSEHAEIADLEAFLAAIERDPIPQYRQSVHSESKRARVHPGEESSRQELGGSCSRETPVRWSPAQFANGSKSRPPRAWTPSSSASSATLPALNQVQQKPRDGAFRPGGGPPGWHDQHRRPVGGHGPRSSDGTRQPPPPATGSTVPPGPATPSAASWPALPHGSPVPQPSGFGSGSAASSSWALVPYRPPEARSVASPASASAAGAALSAVLCLPPRPQPQGGGRDQHARSCLQLPSSETAVRSPASTDPCHASAGAPLQQLAGGAGPLAAGRLGAGPPICTAPRSEGGAAPAAALLGPPQHAWHVQGGTGGSSGCAGEAGIPRGPAGEGSGSGPLQPLLVPPPALVQQSVAQFLQLQRAAHEALDDSDYCAVQGRRFIKKSGWRKLAFVFGVCFELRQHRDECDPRTGAVVRSEFVFRASMPSLGRFADGCGSCSRSEANKRFCNPNHDIPATAETRAKSRACQDLIGVGEFKTKGERSRR